MKKSIAVMAMLLLAACAPKEQPYVERPLGEPAFGESVFLASDGTELPFRQWLPSKKPMKAVVLALHGFNDYSHAFAGLGEYFAQRGVAVYAYDQRGFGNAPEPGIWGGGANLRRDVHEIVAALKERYPGKPVYVLGESMGGAVAIDALSHPDAPAVQGLVLAAPAVWGGDTMAPLYRFVLWVTAYTFPYSSYDGSDLKILASNNIPMLRAMAADPLVLKRSRADAILGLVRLMDDAYQEVDGLAVPVLLLYGGKDQVIPGDAINGAISRFSRPIDLAFYPDGYHMLLRDLQGHLVMKDILGWITDPQKKLPSGFGRHIELPQPAGRAPVAPDDADNSLFSN